MSFKSDTTSSNKTVSFSHEQDNFGFSSNDDENKKNEINHEDINILNESVKYSPSFIIKNDSISETSRHTNTDAISKQEFQKYQHEQYDHIQNENSNKNNSSMVMDQSEQAKIEQKIKSEQFNAIFYQTDDNKKKIQEIKKSLYFIFPTNIRSSYLNMLEIILLFYYSFSFWRVTITNLFLDVIIDFKNVKT